MADGTNSGILRGNKLEHHPEKWKPVFGKDHAPLANLDNDPIQLDRIIV